MISPWKCLRRRGVGLDYVHQWHLDNAARSLTNAAPSYSPFASRHHHRLLLENSVELRVVASWSLSEDSELSPATNAR